MFFFLSLQLLLNYQEANIIGNISLYDYLLALVIYAVCSFIIALARTQ